MCATGQVEEATRVMVKSEIVEAGKGVPVKGKEGSKE